MAKIQCEVCVGTGLLHPSGNTSTVCEACTGRGFLGEVASAPVVPAPPVDNEHVAEGAEQFDAPEAQKKIGSEE